MTWIQVYDPFGHWWLASLVAALPLVVLFGLLVLGRTRPHWAAAAGAMTALAVASLVFGMPVKLAAVSFLYGIAFGLLKIAWIVVAAIYLYDITVHTGQFEIMKSSVARITPDRRLQLLLVAFCFGAFLEGAAGFGTPVAIAGAFMVGLGFRPFHAATLNLIANTAPVAWGAIGTPIHTLAAVMAMPEQPLNAMLGRILPFTAVLIPLWLVRAMVGWSETLEVMPAILVVGVSFGLTQFAWSNFVDSNLVDIVSGVVSLIATLVFLRMWQPKRVWRFEEDRISQEGMESSARRPTGVSDRGTVARAWMPFAILSACVLLWGLPAVKNAMNRATTPAFERKGWDVPVLHNAVLRAQPVVATPTPEPAKFDFNWLSATGSGCLVAAVLSGFLLGVGPRAQLRIFLHTVHRMRYAALAICLMLGFGFITRYSGMDAVLALAFTRTGGLFPFFGTFLGWLGVALTGSDTSSNALFGPLQKITAQQLGLSPVLMGAANSAGGVMGKMVDAQSICVATAATDQVGKEGMILRFLFWHSIALAAIVGAIVMAYAYVFTGAVPR